MSKKKKRQRAGSGSPIKVSKQLRLEQLANWNEAVSDSPNCVTINTTNRFAILEDEPGPGGKDKDVLLQQERTSDSLNRPLPPAAVLIKPHAEAHTEAQISELIGQGEPMTTIDPGSNPKLKGYEDLITRNDQLLILLSEYCIVSGSTVLAILKKN